MNQHAPHISKPILPRPRYFRSTENIFSLTASSSPFSKGKQESCAPATRVPPQISVCVDDSTYNCIRKWKIQRKLEMRFIKEQTVFIQRFMCKVQILHSRFFFFKLKFLVLMEDFFLNLYNLYTLWWRAGLFFVFQTLKYIGKYREGFNMSPFFAGDQWDATTF